MALCFPRKDLFKNGPIRLGIKGSREELKHNLTNAPFSRRNAEKRLSSGRFVGSAAPLSQSSVSLFVSNNSLVLVRAVGQVYPSNSPFGG